MKATIVIVIALAIISFGCQNDMSTNPEQTSNTNTAKQDDFNKNSPDYSILVKDDIAEIARVYVYKIMPWPYDPIPVYGALVNLYYWDDGWVFNFSFHTNYEGLAMIYNNKGEYWPFGCSYAKVRAWGNYSGLGAYQDNTFDPRAT